MLNNSFIFDFALYNWKFIYGQNHVHKCEQLHCCWAVICSFQNTNLTIYPDKKVKQKHQHLLWFAEKFFHDIWPPWARNWLNFCLKRSLTPKIASIHTEKTHRLEMESSDGKKNKNVLHCEGTICVSINGFFTRF